MTLSKVVESEDILKRLGVFGGRDKMLINPGLKTTQIIATAITNTSGAMILKTSIAGTPSNLFREARSLQIWRQIFRT